MALGLAWPDREARTVDWQAAAVAGLAAGAVLMVMELVWAAVTAGADFWRATQLVAALAMGQEVALQSPAHSFDATVVAVALFTHYVLGVAFGLALGALLAMLPQLPRAPVTALVGALFGLVLYLVNFHALTMVFAWFAELRGSHTLLAHLVFGAVAALLYRRLARPGGGRRAGP